MNSDFLDRRRERCRDWTPTLLVIVSLLIVVASVTSWTHISQYESHVGNDATQYLSGARTILESSQYTTSILYFDEHYSLGSIPAEQTVWPPGVSLGIAALASLGLDLEDSARVLAALSYVFLVTATVITVWYLTFSIAAVIAAGVWQLFVIALWRHVGGIGSDLLFTAILAGSVLVYAANVRPMNRREDGSGTSFRIFAIISLLAGAAFVVRYAGALLIAWSMFLIGLEAANRIIARSERMGIVVAKATAAALPAVLIFALLTARNLWLTGSIRGGNNKFVADSVGELVLRSAELLVSMLTGVNETFLLGTSVASTGVGFLALGFLVVLILVAFAGFWRFYSSREFSIWRDSRYFAIASLSVIYFVGVLVVSSRTAVGLDPRYMVPMLPVCIVLLTCLWSLNRSILLAGVVVICITQTMSASSGVHTIDAKPHAYYVPLTEWIKSNSAESEPILVIGDGQKIGYYSERPTLAVPRQHFTAVNWSDARLRDLAETYGVKFLIFNRSVDARQYGTFASSLADGIKPEWLDVAAEFEQAVVYRIAFPDMDQVTEMH